MRCLLVITLLILITACTVNKTLVPTGGSKADGVVLMSYEIGSYEQPIVDWDSAATEAAARCEAWGYKRAEPFAGTQQQCTQYGYYGCTRGIVTVTYQCY